MAGHVVNRKAVQARHATQGWQCHRRLKKRCSPRVVSSGWKPAVMCCVRMRTAVTAAYRELRTQPFGEWLGDQEKRRERSGSKAQRQEQSVEKGQARERSFVQAEEVVPEGLDIGRYAAGMSLGE